MVPEWRHAHMDHVVDEPRKRITARVSENVRAALEQAAELLGSTVNQFMVQTAYQEAQRILERESVIRLSQKDVRKILGPIAFQSIGTSDFANERTVPGRNATSPLLGCRQTEPFPWGYTCTIRPGSKPVRGSVG
jgi:uncharacterized protein (DUF1778 family)